MEWKGGGTQECLQDVGLLRGIGASEAVDGTLQDIVVTGDIVGDPSVLGSATSKGLEHRARVDRCSKRAVPRAEPKLSPQEYKGLNNYSSYY